jgi:hypothetical protein
MAFAQQLGAAIMSKDRLVRLGCTIAAALFSIGYVARPLNAEDSLMKNPTTNQRAQQQSIGTAKMESDGTLVLFLRAEGYGGIIGHATITVPPSDPRYRSYLDHIGGLKPGETKSVPPWE